MSKKTFAALPIFAFLAYWTWACLLCALITRDPRLLKIGFVSLPVPLACALGLRRIFSEEEA